MFLFSIVIMVVAYDDQTGAIYELSLIYYPLFRALFLLCFFFCSHGINLFVWKRFDVDYRAILGVSHSHNYHLVMRSSFMVMSLVFGSFALYVLTLRTPHTSSGFQLPSKHLWPAVALVGTVLIVAWPCDLMPEWGDRAQRRSLFRTLLRVCFSPFFPTNFAATFVADVLTSMPKICSDLQFTACIYSTGSWAEVSWDRRRGELTNSSLVVTCTDQNSAYAAVHFLTAIAPFYFRLMQCCRAYRDTRAAAPLQWRQILHLDHRRRPVLFRRESPRRQQRMVGHVCRLDTVCARMGFEDGLGPAAVYNGRAAGLHVRLVATDRPIVAGAQEWPLGQPLKQCKQCGLGRRAGG